MRNIFEFSFSSNRKTVDIFSEKVPKRQPKTKEKNVEVQSA
jgi:hypothetical protein